MPTAPSFAFALTLCLLTPIAHAIIPTFVRDTSHDVREVLRNPTTQPGDWVPINKNIKAQAYLGFYRDDDRPGDAAKTVRLVKDHPADTHLGITLSLQLPQDYSGELRYRETLTLPRKPGTWDRLNESLNDLRVTRQISPDGRTSTMHELWEYQAGMRILPMDQLPVENLPTPFVCYDFDAGDPAGVWVMECFVNDVMIAHFEFEVITGKPGERELVVQPDELLAKYKPRKIKGVWLPRVEQKVEGRR